jgi:hypothetical protein
MADKVLSDDVKNELADGFAQVEDEVIGEARLAGFKAALNRMERDYVG